MRSYDALTRTGQLRRLRPLTVAASARYGITCRRLTFVADSFNVVFRIQSTTGNEYLMRVAPPLRIHPHGTAHAEAAWLDAIQRDTGIPVARVIKSGDDLTVTAATEGVPQPRTCALFTWIQGRPASLRVTPAIARQAGALLATLHSQASDWNDPVARSAPLANRVLYFDDERCFDRLGRHRSLFAESCERAQATLDRLWAAPVRPPHLLHGDFTPNNLVIGPCGLVPIDFQDLIFGLEIQDVAISLHPFSARPNGAELAAAFQAGYQGLKPWPVEDEATLHDLFAARRLLMTNLALNLNKPGQDSYVEWMAGRLASWMRK
jgi:Ser/Thr protein kinase RdoA (MazF antagonist)